MAVDNLGSARIVADIWRDTCKQKDARIAELEAALRQLLDAVEGAAAHRHVFIPEARAQARGVLQKSRSGGDDVA
jgi:hypothetical protein